MKRKLLAMILFMSAFLGGCVEPMINKTPVPTVISTPETVKTPESTPVVTDAPSTTPVATPEPTPMPSPIGEVTTYINKAGGWQLSFPESWDGWYEVRDRNGESKSATVFFIGKSAKAKEYMDEYGLDVFYITEGHPGEPFDSIHEIGSIDGVDYYFSTSTDSWSGIFDINSEDQKEKEDAEKTLEIYRPIEGNNIDFIVNTFKAIS